MSEGANLKNILLIMAGVMLATSLFVFVLCLLLVCSTGLSLLESVVLLCSFLASIAAHHCPSAKGETANHVENRFLKLF
jgi:hypothetical protein